MCFVKNLRFFFLGFKAKHLAPLRPVRKSLPCKLQKLAHGQRTQEIKAKKRTKLVKCEISLQKEKFAFVQEKVENRGWYEMAHKCPQISALIMGVFDVFGELKTLSKRACFVNVLKIKK
jgi:hypothetical protein